jgi:hypothetical protein
MRGLITYLLCIVVSTVALLHALQPIAATPAQEPVARPVYPNVLVVVDVSVEDALSETRSCEVQIDRVSADTIQVPTLAERDRILKALGCDP